MNPTGKVVVITGATSGLGQASALDLARQGARVILVGRDATRATSILQRIQARRGEGEVILGDVATIAGARSVAQKILQQTPVVDVLINNAGGMFDSLALTEDGVERTFALNTLGAFVLERELHPALTAVQGRVVNVVTGFLDRFPVPVAELATPHRYNANAQYGRTKHATLMLTLEQSRRFQADGVTAVALHPGIVLGTRFGGGQPKLIQAVVGPVLRLTGLACTVQEAVRRFGVASFGNVLSGSYLVNGRPAVLPRQAQDETVRAQVYAMVEQLAMAKRD